MRRFVACPLFVLMCVLVFATARAEARTHRLTSHAEAPVIEFEAQAIAVTGLTPKADAILFGIERQPMPYDLGIRNFTVVLRADERGTVRFPLRTPLSGRAIIAVVDGTRGRYAIESPGDHPLRIRHFPADALKKQNADYLFADLDLTWIEAICVRPGRGSWQTFILDGAGFDADQLSDGKTVIAAGQMKKLSGDESSPTKFHKNDVLIVIDPRTMSVMATEVPE